MATFRQAAMIPKDGLDDFHLSHLLLSGMLRVNYAQSCNLPTNYSKVDKNDPAVWIHPFVTDESSSARQWFLGANGDEGHQASSNH